MSQSDGFPSFPGDSPGPESAGQISGLGAVPAHPVTGGKTIESLLAAGIDVGDLESSDEEEEEVFVDSDEDEDSPEGAEDSKFELSAEFFLSNPSILPRIFDEEPAILENCLSEDPTYLRNYLQATPKVLRGLFERDSNILFYYLSTNLSKLGEFFDEHPESLREILSKRGMSSAPDTNGQIGVDKRLGGDEVCVAGVASNSVVQKHNKASKSPAKSLKSLAPVSTTAEKDAEMFGCYPSDTEAQEAETHDQEQTIEPDTAPETGADTEVQAEESEEDIITPARRKVVATTSASKSIKRPGPREIYGGKRLPDMKSTNDTPDTSDYKDDCAGATDTEESASETDEYEANDSDADSDDDNPPARAMIPYPAPKSLLKASKLVKATKSWRLFEEDLAIGHMLDIRDEGEITGEDRFRETSNRLSQLDNIDRSWGAVKNFWNRTGRARSGFDERKNKKAPLATSRQGKDVQKKRKAAESKRKQTTRSSKASTSTSKVSSSSRSRNDIDQSTTTAKSSATSTPSARKTTSKPDTKENAAEKPAARKTTVTPPTRKTSTASDTHENTSTSKKSSVKESFMSTSSPASTRKFKEPKTRSPSSPASSSTTKVIMSPEALQKLINETSKKAAGNAAETATYVVKKQMGDIWSYVGRDLNSRSETPELQHKPELSSKKRSRNTEDDYEDGQIHYKQAAKKARPAPVEVTKAQKDRYGPDPSDRRERYRPMTKTEKFYSDARRPSPRRREFTRSDRNDEPARGYHERRDSYRPRDDYSDRYNNRDHYRQRPNDYRRRDYNNSRDYDRRY